MSDINLNDLSLDNIAEWPPLIKGILMWLIIFIILALGYFFSFKDQLNKLEKLQRKEEESLTQLQSKQQQAVNLPLYRKQLETMKLEFSVLLKQLPAKTEIPELLEDISRTGIKEGLKFLLFDPVPEIVHDFYIEVPIHIKVDGTYEQLAKFISDIAAMKRIVTIHNFELRVAREKDVRTKAMRKINGRYPLLMKMTAKIYRYKSIELGA